MANNTTWTINTSPSSTGNTITISPPFYTTSSTVSFYPPQPNYSPAVVAKMSFSLLLTKVQEIRGTFGKMLVDYGRFLDRDTAGEELTRISQALDQLDQAIRTVEAGIGKEESGQKGQSEEPAFKAG